MPKPTVIAAAICVLTAIAALVVWHAYTSLSQSATAKIGNESVTLEVAATQEQQGRGLSKRSQLDPTSGMVFVYFPAHLVRFWMVDTLVPLDMFFIRDGKIQKLSANSQPWKGSTQDAPRFGNVVCSEVIELNGKFANKHAIKEGDRVRLEIGFEPYLVNLVDRLGLKLSNWKAEIGAAGR